jgi:tRNA modification GTPase
MNAPGESVFAVLTPPGRGGIAVIRCFGPEAESALAACFRRKSAAQPTASLPPSGSLAYGHIVDADGRAIDEVILFRVPARLGPPCIHEGLNEGCAASESCAIFEINCHGGPAAVAAIGQRLATLGLREASADVLLAMEGAAPVELEARRLLRRLASPLAARILLDQLAGALDREIGEIFANLTAPSRDLHADALARIDTLLARWQTCGRFLADPPRIAIAGRPNAGKSTLLNHLVGTDRAITSPVPGTTRDTVEAAAALEGLPVVLIDTAGLREVSHAVGQGGIEQAGIARAQAESARAAVVIYLVDAREGMQPEDVAAIANLGDRAVVAWNKVDVVDPAHEPAALVVSALSGAGIPALIAAVLARLGWQVPAQSEAVPFAPAQAEALQQARELLARGRPAEARTILVSVLGQ